MYRLHKIMAILLLLTAGAFIYKGITHQTYGNVAYGLVCVFFTYINPIVWNNDGR